MKLKYLQAYPQSLQEQVQQLIKEERLSDHLLKRYPQSHDLSSDKALYEFAMDIKHRYLRKAGPLSKVIYSNKIHVINNALGLHSTASRVQGGKLKSKKEIRISSLFRKAPEALLRMIVVHELAHMRERDHNKAFYKLCNHMDADYHQLEFDLRLLLTHDDFFDQLYR